MLNVVMVKANAGDDDGAVVRIAISVPTEQVRRRRLRRCRRHSIVLVINKVRSMTFSSVRPPPRQCSSVLDIGYESGKCRYQATEEEAEE